MTLTQKLIEPYVSISDITDPTPNPIPDLRSPTRSLSPTREGSAYGVFCCGQGGSRSPPL